MPKVDPAGRSARVIQAHDAHEEGELILAVGATVTNIRIAASGGVGPLGFWRGTCDGFEGIFPPRCVELLPETEKRASSSEIPEVTFTIGEKDDERCITAAFDVPPAAVALLCKMPIVTTGGSFELRPGGSDLVRSAGLAPDQVTCRFYSSALSDPQKTAAMLAERISRRMVDAGSENVDDCCVS